MGGRAAQHALSLGPPEAYLIVRADSRDDELCHHAPGDSVLGRRPFCRRRAGECASGGTRRCAECCGKGGLLNAKVAFRWFMNVNVKDKEQY